MPPAPVVYLLPKPLYTETLISCYVTCIYRYVTCNICWYVAYLYAYINSDPWPPLVSVFLGRYCPCSLAAASVRVPWPQCSLFLGRNVACSLGRLDLRFPKRPWQGPGSGRFFGSVSPSSAPFLLLRLWLSLALAVSGSGCLWLWLSLAMAVSGSGCLWLWLSLALAAFGLDCIYLYNSEQCSN
jgi:hypothetical protein